MSWRELFRLREFGLSYHRPQDFITLQNQKPLFPLVAPNEVLIKEDKTVNDDFPFCISANKCPNYFLHGWKIQLLISNLERTIRFCDNYHQVRSQSPNWKPNNLRVFGTVREYQRALTRWPKSVKHGPPVWYVVWTALWLAYHLIWISFEAYSSVSSSPGKWMLLLTNLSYLALVVFTFIDFITCVLVFFLKTEIIDGEIKSLPWYMKIQWIFMNICGHAALQVTVGYWIMLANSTRATTINKHGINLVYILLLVCFSAKPIKFQHVYQAMLSSLFYVSVNIIYFLASGKILYPFLDWTNPGKSSILSIAFIFISTPLSFFFLFGVYKLRLYAYDKILRYFNNNRNFQEKDEEILDPMKLENGTHV